jgi:hypothetical protein
LPLLNKIVIKGGALNLLAVGEKDKSGEGNQQDFVGCILLGCILDQISLEGNFRAVFRRDLVMLTDGIARSDFVIVNLKKSRSASLIKHAANDGRQFALVIKDGGELVNDANLLFPSDEKEGGDLLGFDALPKVNF